jgi:hypothetical protein
MPETTSRGLQYYVLPDDPLAALNILRQARTHLRPRRGLPQRDPERTHQGGGRAQRVDAHPREEHADYGDDRDRHGSLLSN